MDMVIVEQVSDIFNQTIFLPVGLSDAGSQLFDSKVIF